MASRQRPRCATSTPNCASAFAEVRASAAYAGQAAETLNSARQAATRRFIRGCDLTIATGLRPCKPFAVRLGGRSNACAAGSAAAARFFLTNPADLPVATDEVSSNLSTLVSVE